MEQFNRNKKIKFEDKEIHKKFYGVVMNESKINCHIQVFEAAKSIDDKTFVNEDERLKSVATYDLHINKDKISSQNGEIDIGDYIYMEGIMGGNVALRNINHPESQINYRVSYTIMKQEIQYLLFIMQ